MKIKEIVAAYKALGEAKVNSLEESEILKIVKARKTMRSIAEEHDAFLKDCQEKFKPENFDEIQSKIQNWKDLSDEEKVEVNKVLVEYQNKINSAILEEIEKEVDITIEKLNEDSITKLLKNNEWSANKVDELSIMV